MPLDAPAPGDITEVVANLLYRLEGTVAVVERDVGSRVAEADDVRPTVARKVGKEARVPLDAPAPGDITEVVASMLP